MFKGQFPGLHRLAGLAIRFLQATKQNFAQRVGHNLPCNASLGAKHYGLIPDMAGTAFC